MNPVHPIHEVRDAAKLETLVTSMTAQGWVGEPLLVVDCADHYRALTGSHRIAAAEIAGIEPEISIIYQDDLDDTAGELLAELVDACGDDDRLSIAGELLALGVISDNQYRLLEIEAAK